MLALKYWVFPKDLEQFLYCTKTGLLAKRIKILGFFFDLLSKAELVFPVQKKLTYSTPFVTLPGFGDNLVGS